MSSKIALVALLLCCTVSVYASTDVCSSSSCDNVHLFLARGNNEPHPGRQAALVEAFCHGLDSCGYEDLIYSALYTDLSCQSTYDGTIAGHTQMTAYAQRCPDSKLILTGYSQGAQIVTDILGGAGGVSFNGCIQPSVAALDPTTSPGNKIVAAIAFGNTRHTANQLYNYGSGSAIDGLFPRPATMLTALDKYSGILRDWCLQTDPICAGSQTDSVLADHLGYFDRYSNDAASWIKSVASLTENSAQTTNVPLSLSGTVQDYATIGTFTPSGTVTLHSSNTIFGAQCTSTSSSQAIKLTSTSSSSSSSLSTTSSINPSTISPMSTTALKTSGSPVTTTATSASVTTTSASSDACNPSPHISILLFCVSAIIIAFI